MSCESRHRDIVTTILRIAGLSERIDVDTIMRVGIGLHRHPRGRPTGRGGASDVLHQDVKTAFGIDGHAEQSSPSWIYSMIHALQAAMAKGNRHAFLTLQLLIGGFDAVTNVLEPSDRKWLLSVERLGMTIPPQWRERVPIIRCPSAQNLQILKHAVELMDIVDALIGIDDVPHDVVQAVTPVHVLRFLLGQPFSSVTDLRPVLRAVLEGTPVVHEVVTYVEKTDSGSLSHLYRALIGCAARAQGQSLEQIGGDALLRFAATRIRRSDGTTLDVDDLRHPSPGVIPDIIHYIQHSYRPSLDIALVALLHSCQMIGRGDTVHGVILQMLEQVRCENDQRNRSESTAIVSLVMGIVCPPHGDTVFDHLANIAASDDTAWIVLTAAAVYAATCQQIGYVPHIAGLADRLRTQWPSKRDNDNVSPLPLLAIGRERETLLPVLTAARGTPQWVSMILDCIDAMDMLATVGGDPRALQEVMYEAITAGSGPIDPLIIIRLAASRHGQAILAQLPTVPQPPRWKIRDIYENTRIVPHLVSPWWETAPPNLQYWCQQMMTWIAISGYTYLVIPPPPMYSVIAPQVVRTYSCLSTVCAAIAHPQWIALSEEQRRACLRSVVQGGQTDAIIKIIAAARTTTALYDVRSVLSDMCDLSDDQQKILLRWIDSALGGSS